MKATSANTTGWPRVDRKLRELAEENPSAQELSARVDNTSEETAQLFDSHLSVPLLDSARRDWPPVTSGRRPPQGG
jgi:hypothetical protein